MHAQTESDGVDPAGAEAGDVAVEAGVAVGGGEAEAVRPGISWAITPTIPTTAVAASATVQRNTLRTRSRASCRSSGTLVRCEETAIGIPPSVPWCRPDHDHSMKVTLEMAVSADAGTAPSGFMLA
jgi:hypothetical protein